VKHHLRRHQREPLCRNLELNTETPSKRIADELERRRDLAAVVRLPELDGEAIVSFFRAVAEETPLSEEALRRDSSERLRIYLESVLLEVSNLCVHHLAEVLRQDCQVACQLYSLEA